MTRKIISTTSAPAAIGTYSQAVQVGDTIYMSGQIGLDPVSMQMVDGIDAQIVRVFENLKAVAAAAGATLNDAVKVNIDRQLPPKADDNMPYASFTFGTVKDVEVVDASTVKINLTGSDFRPIIGRPVGESYMTHPATVTALTSAFFAAGARRVRFVESTNLRQPLEKTMAAAGFDHGLAVLPSDETRTETYVELRNVANRLGRVLGHAPVHYDGGAQ